MCRAISQSDFLQSDFLQSIGGENQYEFLVMTFCDSILEDASLKGFFQDIDVEAMVTLMKQFLSITLQPSARLDVFDEDTRGKIVLKNYALFEMGLSDPQFEKLQFHFEFALHDSWLEEEVIDECKQRFSDLRKVFELEGKELEQAAMAHRTLWWSEAMLYKHVHYTDP